MMVKIIVTQDSNKPHLSSTIHHLTRKIQIIHRVKIIHHRLGILSMKISLLVILGQSWLLIF